MDTEQQARIDFLDEANEYFDNLESLLIELDAKGADRGILDSAMRAAHSLKGGAAMMRFETLSKIAHRLEDFLKILRVRQDNSLVDREVTNLLLQGVDLLREARDLHRQNASISEDWLTGNAEPIFKALVARLGSLTDEDEDRLLAEEEQIDVSSLIFQSGVEDCLESFAPQIDLLTPSELKAELALQAEQLAEFGAMSQIQPFVRLCESVRQSIASIPLEKVKDLARQALKLWERSHALVLVGRIDKLPTQIDGTYDNLESPTIDSLNVSDFVDAAELAEIQNFTARELGTDGNSISNNEIDLDEFIPDAADLLKLDAAFESLDSFEVAETNEPISEPAIDFDLDALTPDATELSELNAAFESLDSFEVAETNEPISEPAIDFDFDALTPDAAELSELNAAFARIETPDPIVTAEEVVRSTPVPSTSLQQLKQEQGRMVRVPARQLERLNDLSSQLILERNAALLRLSQLESFVELTKERMRRLEQSSHQLRKLYDWASLVDVSAKLFRADDPISPKITSASVSQTAGVNASWEAISSSTTEKFDALEMDRYSDLHLLSQEQMETIVQLQEVTTDIDLGVAEMGQTIRNLSYTTRELQQTVTRSQMRPFAELVGRFPRLIRDLSNRHNKQVDLIIEGKTTYLDRQALELLADPLTHLLRNAFDHGLEDTETRIAAGKPPKGKIVLKARQQGNQTVITIADDGKGIDPQKIRDRLLKLGFSLTQVNEISETDLLEAIFEPGFSTAEQVTELSGRGVGMDVVRNHLQQIRGDIQVKTELGRGTTFTITVPLSLLVLRVVIVESAGMVFAVPVSSVREIIRYDDKSIAKSDREEQINWNGQAVSLLRLEKHLQFSRPCKPFEMTGNPKIQVPTVLIFTANNQLQGIYLQKYWNEEEVAIRTVTTSIQLFPGFAGSTVLGDGRVIPLIEPVALSKGIAQQQRTSISNLKTSSQNNNSSFDFPASDRSTILVVDDSVNVRRYLAGILERNGYQVEEAKDGQDAVDKLANGLQVQAMICDVEMPRLDGYGVLTEVKSEPTLEHIPIAMLTSRSNDKHRKLAMKLGASAYFSKPFNEQEMLQTLESLINVNSG